MQESYIHLDGEWFFLRHSEIHRSRRTILFVHGLGESSLCFREAFDRLHSLDCNLVAPDNLGYGRSSVARNGDYSFRAQIARLANLVSQLGLHRLTLVGHSLGGNLATYWSKSDSSGVVERLVNVEGSLTPADATFSKLAVEAYHATGGDFGQWYSWFRNEFMEKLILGRYGPDWESCRRYYASLWFCRPEAFCANAREIVEKSQPVEGTPACEIGQTYASLPLPKIYCWGGKHLSEASQRFLNQVGLQNRTFRAASHWPMIDCPEEFYSVLKAWVAQDVPPL
jgi:pimeloyl-ACP methyl ester carboxylesterase